jgi:hypothetical protein
MSRYWQFMADAWLLWYISPALASEDRSKCGTGERQALWLGHVVQQYCASAKEGTLNISSPPPNSDAWVTIRLKPVDSSKIFKTLMSNISIEIYNRDQKSELLVCLYEDRRKYRQRSVVD